MAYDPVTQTNGPGGIYGQFGARQDGTPFQSAEEASQYKQAIQARSANLAANPHNFGGEAYGGRTWSGNGGPPAILSDASTIPSNFNPTPNYPISGADNGPPVRNGSGGGGGVGGGVGGTVPIARPPQQGGGGGAGRNPNTGYTTPAPAGAYPFRSPPGLHTKMGGPMASAPPPSPQAMMAERLQNMQSTQGQQNSPLGGNVGAPPSGAQPIDGGQNSFNLQGSPDIQHQMVNGQYQAPAMASSAQTQQAPPMWGRTQMGFNDGNPERFNKPSPKGGGQSQQPKGGNQLNGGMQQGGSSQWTQRPASKGGQQPKGGAQPGY